MKRLKIKKVIKLLLLICLFQPLWAQKAGFKTEQLKYSRVKQAYKSKWPALQKELAEMKINTETFDIYLRAFKYEKQLEVWVKNKTDQTFKRFKTYAICASSGNLGPKRKEGDGQVPEGFYRIEAFNPVSNYHLSLKVNYPNASDVKMGKKPLGGDIMIHGNCVTIGCIPIEDDPIEELYVLCVQAKSGKSHLPVDIFPCRFTPENEKMLRTQHDADKLKFWEGLKEVYESFERNKKR